MKAYLIQILNPFGAEGRCKALEQPALKYQRNRGVSPSTE